MTVNGRKIDLFTRGYLETALWSSTYETEDRDDAPMDDEFSLFDFAPAALDAAIKDCEAFQADETDDLDATGLGREEAGGLFWLNRNGHGVGFWDKPGGEVGNRLSKAAKVYGSVDLYVGDDGKVHGG